MLCSLTPPVGLKRTSGNGPPNAFSAPMPPTCSAGNSFTVVKPRAIAAMISDAVPTPGTNGTPRSAAASSSSGVAPGLKANGRSRRLASFRSRRVTTVPSPTIASATSALIAAAASAPAAVRKVISSVRTPPATSALASGTARSTRSIVSTGISRAARSNSGTLSFAVVIRAYPSGLRPADIRRSVARRDTPRRAGRGRRNRRRRVVLQERAEFGRAGDRVFPGLYQQIDALARDGQAGRDREQLVLLRSGRDLRQRDVDQLRLHVIARRAVDDGRLRAARRGDLFRELVHLIGDGDERLEVVAVDLRAARLQDHLQQADDDLLLRERGVLRPLAVDAEDQDAADMGEAARFDRTARRRFQHRCPRTQRQVVGNAAVDEMHVTGLVRIEV